MLPRELSYIILFLIQFLIGLSFVVWHEVGRVTTDDVVETTLNILQRTGGTVALFVVMTYVAIESWRMLAERYEQRRYREGKAEGKAEGRARQRVWRQCSPRSTKKRGRMWNVSSDSIGDQKTATDPFPISSPRDPVCDP